MRVLLLFLAHQEGFKNFFMKFKFFRDTAWRFVAGESLDAAMPAVREANGIGIRCSLDQLGENTLSSDDALRATDDAITILKRIKQEKADCNVSVKLTQLGLDLDEELCYRNLARIAACAKEMGNFVRVDMEDHNYTQKTLDIVLKTRREFENVGTVIQSYLYRSEEDVRLLLQNKVCIRLCKGAYLEPVSVAFRKKSDTDANFVRLMKLLLKSDLYHGIATHD